MLNRVLNVSMPVDGIIGPKTRGFVAMFQERYGLPVDGYLNQKTRSALRFENTKAMRRIMKITDPKFVVFVDAGHGVRIA